MKRYDEYKDSGVEWIGEVPRHWEVVRTCYLCNLCTGNKDTINRVDDGKFPFYVRSPKVERINTYSFDGEAILMAGDGVGAGKVFHYANGKFDYHQRVYNFHNFKKVIGKFFYYYITNNFRYIIEEGGAKNTVDSVRLYMIQNFLITVPPKEEQREIVFYLDKKCSEIDNVISAQQKRIALLQELKQSVITHAVTKGLNPNVEMKDSGVEWIGKIPKHWEIYKIKNCCKSEQYSIKTGPFGTQLKGEDLQPQGDVAVYSQQNVINNDFTKIRYFVSFKKAETLKGFYTKPDDVLVTSRGTIGKAAILSPSFPIGILHPCLIALRLNQKICQNDWLVMYVNETDCFKTDVYLSSNATTIDVIYTGTLKNIYIPIPPYEEQIEILKSIKEKCASIDSSISKAQYQVELLQEYKQSLITEVVTGKRKVS